MARENLNMKEQLGALVIRPRSVQRLHEKVDCEAAKDSADRTVKESIEIEKKEKS